MKDLHEKLKEYKKFYRLFKKDKLEKNVHLWYDIENNKYFVSTFLSKNTILNICKLNFELIK